MSFKIGHFVDIRCILYLLGRTVTLHFLSQQKGEGGNKVRKEKKQRNDSVIFMAAVCYIKRKISVGSTFYPKRGHEVVVVVGGREGQYT